MPSPQAMPILDPFNLWVGFAIIGVLAGAGWLYLLYMSWAMDNMDTVDMWMPPVAGVRLWTLYDFLMLFLMWAIMMVAMMLPSAIPTILVFMRLHKTRLHKQNRAASVRWSPALATGVFISGYLAAWTFYSFIVSIIQWQMHDAGLFNPMMTGNSYLLSGAIILAAGIYQWTPVKDNCLRYCRSPLAFLLAEWRENSWGQLRMGLRHGMYCVGCCAFLMAILFAVGVMNMLWVVLLTVLVALEKTLIPPHASSVVVGGALSIWGVWWIGLHWWP